MCILFFNFLLLNFLSQYVFGMEEDSLYVLQKEITRVFKGEQKTHAQYCQEKDDIYNKISFFKGRSAEKKELENSYNTSLITFTDNAAASAYFAISEMQLYLIKLEGELNLLKKNNDIMDLVLSELDSTGYTLIKEIEKALVSKQLKSAEAKKIIEEKVKGFKELLAVQKPPLNKGNSDWQQVDGFKELLAVQKPPLNKGNSDSQQYDKKIKSLENELYWLNFIVYSQTFLFCMFGLYIYKMHYT